MCRKSGWGILPMTTSFVTVPGESASCQRRADSATVGSIPAPPPSFGSSAPPTFPEPASPLRHAESSLGATAERTGDAAFLPLPRQRSPRHRWPLHRPVTLASRRFPPAAALVPGNRNVVENPFVHEDVVTRPSGTVPRSGDNGRPDRRCTSERSSWPRVRSPTENTMRRSVPCRFGTRARI